MALTKQLKTIERVRAKVRAEISANSVGKYGVGLAGEGYAGGYVDALNDLELFLNSGVIPNNKRGYWSK